VFVTQLGDYFVGVQLLAWLGDETKHIVKRVELREKVFEALRGAGVDMPCETLSHNPISVKQAA
jgi:small conductance mechanosensitive channel